MKLGLVVGGGPAPGINGVISSAAIEGINRGFKVVGFMDGFKFLAAGHRPRILNFKISEVSRIHVQGGSLIRTSRVNPVENQETVSNVLSGLKRLRVGSLMMIGGEGTLSSAYRLFSAAKGSVQIVHVPKTIDNDLPLPGNMPTFGFETARHVGSQLVANLMEDARTTRRWFFVVAMGRLAGHLALGIAKASGATLALIPEEFEDGASLNRVCDTLEGAIIKRLAQGKDYGVAVIAEGLSEKLNKEDLETLVPGRRDDQGHLRLAEIGFSEFLKRRVETSLKERGLPILITDKNVGYELRCADPIPFDIEYTRNLGYGAVKFLAAGGSGATITLQGGKMAPVGFSKIIDPKTRKSRVRLVDTRSENYEVALRYMIRLTRDDFRTQRCVRALAKAAKMENGIFRERFGPVAI
ncbi:MAG: 6-phosphofructokinase [Elusimicrobia bacterium]|nr:6-phosphofructokinase [Elusimicrobiota bacterium]